MAVKLRSVPTTDQSGAPVDMTMPDAIRALAEQVIADGPVVVLMLWEQADPKDPEHVNYGTAALPDSQAVIRGLIEAAYGRLHPVGDDTE